MAATEEKFKEIFSLSQDEKLAEVGGGHGQKGVDFQRYWAMVRIFELKHVDAPDFLILFESVQDLAELDSETTPSKIDIYQIKKKDAGEWSFNSLTGLQNPKPGKTNKIDADSVSKSALGKLYRASVAFQYLKSQIHFVSNAGCDFPLAATGKAAKNLVSLASDLDAHYVCALRDAFALLHDPQGPVPDLNNLSLRKTTLHPDDQERLALGAAVEYLTDHMPDHAGQAKSLVDLLFARLSALGRQTNKITSFNELRSQRGFSKKEMDAALNNLENIPDLKKYLEMMLEHLATEGLGPVKRISVLSGATHYFTSLVTGHTTSQETALIDDCCALAPEIVVASPMLPILESHVAALKAKYSAVRDSQIFAYLLIQVSKHAAT